MKTLLQAISESPFALIPPFHRDKVNMGWYRLKSNGALRIANDSVTLNVENAGGIQYLIHNGDLSKSTYYELDFNHHERSVVLINTDLLSKSILDQNETIVLAMTGHVLTSSGMCEIMTSLKIDGILEEGFEPNVRLAI